MGAFLTEKFELTRKTEMAEDTLNTITLSFTAIGRFFFKVSFYLLISNKSCKRYYFVMSMCKIDL